MKDVPVKDFFIGEKHPLAVMSGPCVIESEDHALMAAESLVRIFQDLKNVNFISNFYCSAVPSYFTVSSDCPYFNHFVEKHLDDINIFGNIYKTAKISLRNGIY